MLEYAYQMGLKVEEKLSRKQGQRGRGRSQAMGKSVVQDRCQKPKEDWKKPQPHIEKGGSSQKGKYAGQRRQYADQRGEYVDNNIFPRTRGRGRGRSGVIKCFTCGKVVHKSYECLDKKKEEGETHIVEEERQNVEAEDAEGGRSLMM
jgi:hypothetical protein